MSKELDYDMLYALATMGVDKEYHELVLNSQEFLHLQQSLTPPTAEEVCKALSDYVLEDVWFNNEHFVYYRGGLLLQIDLNTLPHNIIEMIGRFYKEVK